MATRHTEPDPALEDVQKRVDEIRRHLHETPGTTAISPERHPRRCFEDEAFDDDDEYMGQPPG